MNRYQQKEAWIMNVMSSIPVYTNDAVVYDIDDTLIDQDGKPITPIINTYHHALRMGLIPIIITARPGTPQNIALTKSQLKSYNITNYRLMYFQTPGKTDHARFKTLARKNIQDRGYNVTMSIGDMPWDIGLYGGIGFIL